MPIIGARRENFCRMRIAERISDPAWLVVRVEKTV